MFKKIALLALVFATYVPANALTHEASLLRPSYVCQRAKVPPLIDGKLDDAVWQKACRSASFVDIEGARVRTPAQATYFQMAWDEKFLYIAAHMREKNVWATLRERDSIIYQDPDFEVFIDPDCDGKNYIELEINALNTVWDLFLTAPYSDPKQVVLHDWDIKKLRTAVAIDGTLNDPSDEDAGWTAEIAIPWESITGNANLPRRGEPPAAGTQMRMNFSRVGWKTVPAQGTFSGSKKQTDANGKNLPETNDVWAATGEINIHVPELWGDVFFSEKPAGTWESRFAKTSTGTPKVYLWVHGGESDVSEASWKNRLASYKAAGIDCIVSDGSVETVATLARLANATGLETIAWVWTLNQCCDKTIFRPENKNLFSVSREGKSCFEEKDRPYVPYYAFLCPNNPAGREHLKKIVEKYATIPHLSAIQLDYIRLVDVILPRGLWEKYKLVQDHEMPQFDFCYCALCQEKFKEKYGREIFLKNAEKDAKWREFRLESVAEIANFLADVSREHRLPCGAAVFPTPKIAAQLVRQDWSRFRLDFAFPMDYNSFYNEPAIWIGEKTKEAVEQIEARFPIAPGLHLPDIPADTLAALLDEITKTGATGIALFSNETLTPAHASALKAWKDRHAPPAR